MEMTHQICHSKVSLLKLPYIIYNLDAHKSIYIWKGTVVAYANKDEPEVDCFEISETYEEAQEVMQYRNHLPNHPTLLVPLMSDMICSPAEVKFHRRVELKEHNVSVETKKRFEEFYQQFPEVFPMNNEDISRTNLITMDIDTGDSPPSAKEALYTGTQIQQLGTTGDRELSASRDHHQKCLTMDQSYCCGPQEVCTWRSTKEENVHRFPCCQCPTAYSGQG